MEAPQRKPPGMPFEDWIERQVREAEERGEFKDLPGAGLPLPGADGPYDPDWWIKKKLESEGVTWAPEPLRLRREAERRCEDLLRLPSEAAVRREVAEINSLIRKSNRLPAPDGLAPAPELDEELEVERWRSASPRSSTAAKP